jgi:mxaJ protein
MYFVPSARRTAVGVALCLALAAATRASPSEPPVLRVCADPNNLPFSNARGEGFENRLAETIAHSLGARVEYTWWPQRRGFLRSTLLRGACDVVPGLPTATDMALTTVPYYRSTYVFVARDSLAPRPRSLDDPALRRLRIGVQLVGDDGANTPPVHALSRRGITHNLRGYLVTGDYGEESPPARIVEAVARGDVDVAIVWGPLAGWFAPRQRERLVLEPVEPQVDVPFLPFVFDVSMAVRRGDEALRDRLERALAAERRAIDALLADYGVPRVDRPAPAELAR